MSVCSCLRACKEPTCVRFERPAENAFPKRPFFLRAAPSSRLRDLSSQPRKPRPVGRPEFFRLVVALDAGRVSPGACGCGRCGISTGIGRISPRSMACARNVLAGRARRKARAGSAWLVDGASHAKNAPRWQQTREIRNSTRVRNSKHVDQQSVARRSHRAVVRRPPTVSLEQRRSPAISR